MEEPFGSIPDSLMEKALELYPNLMDYNQVDFVAVGAEGSWVMGIMGQLVFWDKIEAQVIKHLTRVWTETGSVRVSASSPLGTRPTSNSWIRIKNRTWNCHLSGLISTSSSLRRVKSHGMCQTNGKTRFGDTWKRSTSSIFKA